MQRFGVPRGRFGIQAWALTVAVAGAGLLSPSAKAAPTELTVSAAASLKDVLKELGQRFEKSNPAVHVRFNFGSSGTLQTQIEQGAPVDVFISAADRNVNELIRKQLAEAGSRRVLAENRLVLVVPKGSKLHISRFKDVSSSVVQHVGVGGPTVPAGIRAQEVFTKLGIWPAVQAKAVRGKDVREVLAQVQIGNVEAGVVYATDAAATSQVRVVAIAPAAMHSPIRYPAVILSDSRNKAAASAFTRYLTSPPARAVFRRQRFLVP